MTKTNHNMTNEEEPPGKGGGLVRTQSMNIDITLANEVFDHFCSQANTLKSILRSFSYLCEILRIKPTEFPYFYPKIKSKLKSWKAQALWAKFDKRASHKVYNRGKACAGQRMLVIGAGPCGLRTAIEAQLLGAKVVVVEKRDRFSRNNVLHLWPYNIHDLRGLGAKKFYGKFCAGSIDHISIRQLQCILLKVCLLLGVEVYESVGFENLIEPTDVETGWRAEVSPPGHPVSHYEFDVLIGADGKRNTLHGFKRKEFRGKLAIAVTANFIRSYSEAESQVEEISGVAFIFNQKFFNDLQEAKGISLENIVYYKDETHYFVMTAKKQSLIEKGAIIRNDPDTAKLLSPDNIRTEKLFEFAREAADFATNYQLPQLDFAVNHYGKPDVAMFDFTSMFQAENSCRAIERHGHRLLVCLVGDSLLEPFWPTGTGCPRGFLGGLDACWLMRQLASGKMTLLEALAERESIYRLLPQTTPENTSKDYSSYTVEPQTRYPTLNTKLVLPAQVVNLVDTDNPSQLEEELRLSNSNVTEPQKRRRKESHVSPDTLQRWLAKQVESYENVTVTDMTTSFQNGLALCAILHRYRPDLIDFEYLDKDDVFGNIQLAFDILELELGIPPIIPASELADVTRVPDKLAMMTYLSQVYECFRKDIPAVNRISSVYEDEEDLLDAEFRRKATAAKRTKHPENGAKLSIGQLVASEASKKVGKKRRSKESVDLLEDEFDEKKTVVEPGVVVTSNKENVMETARLNKTANRKRLLKLLERAEKSAAEKKHAVVRKSIKDEERYKVIEAQFCGGGSSKRKNMGTDIVAKYRENKRPKDLRRAIGRIDKEDWNIKNIEEKLLTKKEPEVAQRDKVPKWSKAAFQDKFNIMKGKLENGEESNGSKKYVEVDSSLARLQRKLQEGSALEIGQRGSNRVSALAGELFEARKPESMDIATSSQPKNVPESLQPTVKLKPSGGGGSEICHFCAKRVYVVERMSAEGKFFHRSCFRCDYCNVLLRLGSYVYHREGHFSGKFFCVPHSTEYSLEKYRYKKKNDEIKDAEFRQQQLAHKAIQEWTQDPSSRQSRYLDSLPAAQRERFLSSLRGTTPERAEFEASIDHLSEEEPPSIMDEDEWTDRNFGNSLLADNDENDTSEDSVSDLDSDSESSDEVEKAEDEKLLTSLETRQLRQEWRSRYRQNTDEDRSQYDNVPKERMSGQNKFKVFTLNCYAIAYVPFMSGEKRKERIRAIAKHLSESSYDFVALQEVWTEGDQNEIKYLCAKNLPHSVTFFGGIIGTGTLVLSKFPISETMFRKFSLNGFIHHLQYGDGLTGAGIGMARIRVDDGIVVNFYVSHFHAEYHRTQDPYLTDRIVQAYEAGNFIELTSTKGELAIYCGDFNSEPGDPPHQILTQLYGLKDSHGKKSIATHYLKENSFTDPEIQRAISIDYIMHKPTRPDEFTSATSTLKSPLPSRIPGDNVSYSDHEAIVTEITLKKHYTRVQCHEADEKNSIAILENISETLTNELESNWKWQFFHFGCLMTIFLMILKGFFRFGGFFGAFLQLLHGVGLGCFVYLVLFYQNRKYTLRQHMSDIKLLIKERKKNLMESTFDRD